VPGREQQCFEIKYRRDEHDPVERDPVAFQPAAEDRRTGRPVAFAESGTWASPAAVAATYCEMNCASALASSSTPQKSFPVPLPTGLENPVRWDR